MLKAGIIKVNNDGKLSEVNIDVPDEIIKSSTFVPFRALEEISGASVEWNQDDWTVLIKTK